MNGTNKTFIFRLFFAACLASFVAGCTGERTDIRYFAAEDSVRIIDEILSHRTSVDSSFRYDPGSPFVRDTSIRFTGIKWFPPDLKYYFRSKLKRYEKPETVQVYGTKGEPRNYIRYGYFTFESGGKNFSISAYKILADNTERSRLYEKYLSVWFTDETTGRETYHVGRYLEVGEEESDPDYLYTLNFNNAYSPYCSYSTLYSCAVPRREDHLALAINAGELTYHK